MFVLMLENRSFDHMLGFSGIEGADAVSGARTGVEGLDGSQTNIAGGQTFVAQAPAPYQMGFDPGHGFMDVVEQLGGPGTAHIAGQPYPALVNSGFAANAAANLAASGISGLSPGEVLASFSPEQLPVINALAREFVVCDRWFSSMPGATWPNRLFLHAATSGGLDDSPSSFQSVETLFKGYRFANGTIYDQLDKKGFRWSIVKAMLCRNRSASVTPQSEFESATTKREAVRLLRKAELANEAWRRYPKSVAENFRRSS